MPKNIVVISTSLRKDSNSDFLADEFIRGAKDAGHRTEKISLAGKSIAFCKGCMTCSQTQVCAIKDDANAITQKVQNADVVVWATPVYYYSMSGQMKTLIDRMNSMYSTDYLFRDVYLLATSEENKYDAIDGTVKGVEGWVNCYEKSVLKNVLRATGVCEAAAIKQHPEYAEQAYKMGKNA